MRPTVLLAWLFPLCLPILLNAQSNRPIGTNLSSVHDYSTELVFTDAFKQSRTWISFDAAGGGAWNTNIAVPLDSATGYPLELPYDDGVNPPQGLRALMLWGLDTALPVGQYRLIVQGTGQIKLKFGATGTYNCPIDTMVTVTDQVALEILSSQASQPISDIKFIYPDYINTYQNQTFTNEFLSFLDDFQVLRFMDWLRTNHSPTTQWSERGKYHYYTQSQRAGVAWEYIIELANLKQKDLWINIPHQVDDQYIQQLATLLEQQVDTNLLIYLEYSNEVWNASFSQHQDAAQAAQNLGYTGQTWELAWQYTAKRSADVFHIFEQAFANDARLVKVIPSQAANSWLSNRLMTFFNDPIYNPNQVSADALAIAPYFAGNVANEIVNRGAVATVTIAEIVDSMEASLSVAYDRMTQNKLVADNHNLDLIAYEGGQHLVATNANVNNNALTAKLMQANHHPDLQQAYCQYFDYWYQNGGGLFAHFSSHGSYSKWGSWGVKETMADTLNPKYLALKNCVFNANVLTTNKLEVVAEDQKTWIIYPNPSVSGQFTITSEELPSTATLQVFDVLGRAVPVRIQAINSQQQVIQVPQPGHYWVIWGDQVRQIVYP